MELNIQVPCFLTPPPLSPHHGCQQEKEDPYITHHFLNIHGELRLEVLLELICTDMPTTCGTSGSSGSMPAIRAACGHPREELTFRQAPA